MVMLRERASLVRLGVLLLACGALWALVESTRAAPGAAPPAPGVTVSAPSLSVQQGATGSFTVVLDKQPSAGVSFTVFPRDARVALVSTPDGSHPAYANPARSTFIRFDTADWGTPKTIRVHGQAVGEVEIEMFMFTSDPAYEDVATPSVSATVSAGPPPTTTPPPPPPKPTVTIAAGSGVTEGAAATFTLTASPAPTAAISVSVAITQSGSFVTTGTRTVSVGASGTATLTVSTTNDSTYESHGSVTATVQAGSSYTVGTPAAATVAVADDDGPTVTIAAGSGVTEGAAATFTLTASPAPTAAISVSVAITQSGSFATTGTRTVSIGTGGTATLTVSTADDSVDEADGSVTVTVQAGSSYTVGSPAAATVTVADNDAPPSVIVTPADMWVSEQYGEQMHPLRALAGGDAADVEALRRITAKEISLPFGLRSPYRGIGLKLRNDLCLQLGTDPGAGQTATVTVPLPADLYFSRLSTSPPLAGASKVIDRQNASFKFTGGSSGNWAAQQCVVVYAQWDPDMTDDTGTITMSVAGYGSLTSVSSDYTVYDDYWAHMTIYPASRLELSEGGSAKTYNIQNHYSHRFANAVVAIAPKVACADDGDGDDDGDGELDEYCDTTLITVSQSTYTFAYDGTEPVCDGAWICSHPIKVTPGADADYLDTELFIEHTFTDFWGYTGPLYLPVTLAEPVGIVQAFPPRLALFDGAGSGATHDLADTLNVRLHADPGTDITVTLDCTSAKLSCSQASLTFTHGNAGNWGAYQQITVTPAHDADSTDAQATITLTPASSASSKPTTVKVTIEDDD